MQQARAHTALVGGLKPALRVFLPFAAGYYLSYLYRVINAVVAEPLVADLGIEAASLGLLTAIYFLSFAAVQIPVGMALDRYGARRVQTCLLMIAAAGSAVFSYASSVAGLLLGRALIGLGVAGTLVAGLKAIFDCWPRERLPLVNGAFVAIGALGAISATAPANWVLEYSDWRTLFMVLAVATALTAMLTFLVVVEPCRPTRPAALAPPPSFRAIYGDKRFWRLAPLSALCIGSAWALQGLWAAPWLADVAQLPRDEVVQHLFFMAIALCVGALVFGTVAERLRRKGIGLAAILSVTVVCLIAAEAALAFRMPLPSAALWGVVAATGAATVLSYGLIADFFPNAIGRANSALNLLHIGAAFVLQGMVGAIISFWSRDVFGQNQPEAYGAALLTLAMLQLLALTFFLLTGSQTDD